MNDDERMQDLLDRVEGCWVRGRMRPVDRRRLVRLLEDDLAAARVAGAPVDELMPSDVPSFAIELAAAHGVDLDVERVVVSPGPPRGPATSTLVGAGLLGGVVGFLVGWYLLLVGPLGDALYEADEIVGAVACLLLTGVLTAAGMAGALVWSCRNAPGARRLALATAVEAVFGGTVGLLAAVLFAASSDFSTQPEVVLVEVGLVAAGCALAMIAGRRWVPIPGSGR